jgi:hypothetical protein
MKISPKTKATIKTVSYVALFGLAAVVLVKIYKTADQYDKLGKKLNSEGLKSLF